MKARDQEVAGAIARERGRCLWVLDRILVELQAELAMKLLIETERHVVGVKVKLARAIIAKARRAIVSGARPAGGLPDGRRTEEEVQEADPGDGTRPG